MHGPPCTNEIPSISAGLEDAKSLFERSPYRKTELTSRHARHHYDDCAAEIGQVVGLAARYEIAIDDNGRIQPNGTGIHEIVFDTERTGHFRAAIDAGRDCDPAAVADCRHELVVLGEFADQALHFFV